MDGFTNWYIQILLPIHYNVTKLDKIEFSFQKALLNNAFKNTSIKITHVHTAGYLKLMGLPSFHYLPEVIGKSLFRST